MSCESEEQGHGGIKDSNQNPESDRNKESDSIKIDLDTPLETLFVALMSIGGIATLACLSIGLIDGKRAPADPAFLKYLSLTVPLVLAAFVLKRGTDNYFIVHVIKRRIYYHFGFFGTEKITPYLDFSNIQTLTVTGKKRRSKHSNWYAYKIVLVDKRGKTHDFSDLQREAREEFNERARKLSTVLSCGFIECPQMGAVLVEVAPRRGVSVTHKLPTEIGSRVVVLAILVTLIIFISIVLFMIFLAK